MKILRQFKVTKDNAEHSPWGKKFSAPAALDEAGIEFTITAADFKDPACYGKIFGKTPEIICYSICSRISSKWGVQVNNRWVFKASPEQTEAFRALWIAERDAAQYSHTAIMSQAHAQQWMSYVMIDFIKDASLPHVPAELLNS